MAACYGWRWGVGAGVLVAVRVGGVRWTVLLGSVGYGAMCVRLADFARGAAMIVHLLGCFVGLLLLALGLAFAGGSQ